MKESFIIRDSNINKTFSVMITRLLHNSFLKILKSLPILLPIFYNTRLKTANQIPQPVQPVACSQTKIIKYER